MDVGIFLNISNKQLRDLLFLPIRYHNRARALGNPDTSPDSVINCQIIHVKHLSFS